MASSFSNNFGGEGITPPFWPPRTGGMAGEGKEARACTDQGRFPYFDDSSSDSSSDTVASPLSAFAFFGHSNVRSGGVAAEAKQDNSPVTPAKAADKRSTSPAFYDFTCEGEESILVEKKIKRARADRAKFPCNATKGLPIRCTKCNLSFRSVKDRTHHIKISTMHICCPHCDPIVEFIDYLDLDTHYQSHHCRRCNLHFPTIQENDTHKKTSALHFCCQICPHAVEFDIPSVYLMHYKKYHPLHFCYVCDKPFQQTDERRAHMYETHVSCASCPLYFHSPDQLWMHQWRYCRKKKPPPVDDRGNASKGAEHATPCQSHYETLGVGLECSHEEILRKAKAMRVETHPDRVKKGRKMTVEEEGEVDRRAARVGQAADVLSDPAERARYDQGFVIRARRGR